MKLAGIRREDRNAWERRAPLTPEDARRLAEETGARFAVQPSSIRVFPDADYARAGCAIAEDLSACDIVFAVKEIPPELYRPGRTYVTFSHAIKGQPHAMPALRRALEVGATLVDYERIVDEGNRRLVFFGTFAGEVGMADTLWTLGRRLRAEGIETPFADVKQTLEYGGLEPMLAALRAVGGRISREGLADELVPFAVGILGYGNVSKGAQRALFELPVGEVAPGRLPALFAAPPAEARRKVYLSVFREEDLVEPAAPGAGFDLQDYYRRPEGYRARFAPFLPILTVAVNAVYWTKDYPRFVTAAALRGLFRPGGPRPRLRVIGDISCDIEGAVEVTRRATDPGNPVYVYDAGRDDLVDGVEGNGPAILAVDNLPCEVPAESSRFFSSSLLPFASALLRADLSLPFAALDLPAPVKNAVIAHQGSLAPGYGYLGTSFP